MLENENYLSNNEVDKSGPEVVQLVWTELHTDVLN